MQKIWEIFNKNSVGRSSATFSDIADKLAAFETAGLVGLAKEIQQATEYNNQKSTTRFQFITNTGLGGGPEPCGEAACRIANLNNTATFAALYADKICIPSPIDRLLNDAPWLNEDRLRIELVLAIFQIKRIAPLLEAGLISFASTHHYNFCPSCYVKHISPFKKTTEQDLQKLRRGIDRIIRSNIDFTATLQQDGAACIEMRGPSEFMPHGGAYITYAENSEITKRAQRHASKMPMRLSSYQVKNWGLQSEMALPLYDDILRQNYYSNLFSTSYLTDREIDLEIISTFSKGDSVTRSSILSDFSHSLPIVSNTTIKKLLKLRSSEGDAFRTYRDAVEKSVKELAKLPEKGGDILNDIIRPELNNISAKISGSRKIFWNNIKAEATLGAISVGLGLYNGILPANIGAMISAIGGFHYGKEVIRNIRGLISDEAVRDQKFYFLWKAQRNLSILD